MSFIKRRSFLVILLILAISFSPRISVGKLDSRSIDLRLEDFVLAAVFVFWFFRTVAKKSRIYTTPVARPVLLYVFFASLSTYLGILFWQTNPAKSVLYYLKEIEYLLTFLMVANFTESENDILFIMVALLLCASANGLYAFSSLFLGKFFSYYGGVGTIGEPSKFSTGGYFAISLAVSFSVFVLSRKPALRLLSLAAGVLCILGVLGSTSRSNVLGLIVACAVLFIIRRKDLKLRFRNIGSAGPFGAVLAVIAVFVVVWGMARMPVPTLKYFSNVKHIKESMSERVDLIYIPLSYLISKDPVFGLGKDASSRLIGGTGEAHNYYLRAVIESGFVGLTVFILMLYAVASLCMKTMLERNCPGLGKASAVACFLTLIMLVFGSFAQDAFTPVKVNEMFWLLAGLCAASYRLSKERGNVAAGGYS